MFSMYWFCKIVIVLLLFIISIPIILAGSPRSVISHSEHKSFFILSHDWVDDVNRSKSWPILLLSHTLLFPHAHIHKGWSIVSWNCAFRACYLAPYSIHSWLVLSHKGFLQEGRLFLSHPCILLVALYILFLWVFHSGKLPLCPFNIWLSLSLLLTQESLLLSPTSWQVKMFYHSHILVSGHILWPPGMLCILVSHHFYCTSLWTPIYWW